MFTVSEDINNYRPKGRNTYYGQLSQIFLGINPPQSQSPTHSSVSSADIHTPILLSRHKSNSRNEDFQENTKSVKRFTMCQAQAYMLVVHLN